MNSKLKPKIRFKGFTDDWEQRKFDDWGTFYYGHICPKWSVTENSTIPCIRYGELYTKFGEKIDAVYSYTSINPNKLRFSKGTEVLIPRVGEDPMDYNHCTWLSLKDVAIGEMISVFNTNQHPLFSAIMFNATLQKEFAVRVEGSSVTNLYFEKLKDINIKYPKIQEQEKIANIFDNLDNLITLHQRKCDKLIEIKKSLLEKMFPQNNSVIPEIRFRGFTDDWEQRKLNDIYTFSQGMQVEIENQSLNKSVDMEQFIRIIDVTTNSEPPRYIYNTTGKGHVESNDIFFVRYGAVGTVGYGYTGTIANNLFKLSTNKKYCNDFMYQQFANGEFNKKLIEMSASTSMPAINFSALNSLTFYETNLDEQNRIGKLFKSIDNLITLHQRKHDKLNKIKQSLLNDMFV